MRREGIAVVGDRDSVLAFKAVGAAVFPVADAVEARETVKTLARSYSVIFITDMLAEQIQSLLDRYKTRTYPAVIPIPSAAGATGFGIAGVKKDVERAIGADILFGKDE